MPAMTGPVDNLPDADYASKIASIAAALNAWDGAIVIATHVDPDGDAIGSSLALKRALEAMGKHVRLPLEPPSYLRFLATEGELSPVLDSVDGAMLIVLDVSDAGRMAGAPLGGAARTINLDHHGTNDRFGDLALVDPTKAATAVIVKDLIDALPVSWSVPMATPCLTGMLTDTGNFRFGNTDREVLTAAADLIDVGVPFADLTDRLQWRDPNYFRLLGAVMGTVRFDLGGRLVTARLTNAMRDATSQTDDDSDDFVGIIRYAEGAVVAALFKERDDHIKVSVRTRPGVSAQAICVGLGGGGHVVAAGASLATMDFDEAERLFCDAVEAELARVDARSAEDGALNRA